MPTTFILPNGKKAGLKDMADGRKRRAKLGGFPPPKPIPVDGLEAFAAMMCTQAEVAGFYNVSVETLRNRLKNDPEARKAWQRGRAKASVTLRRKQFEVAQTGNVPMLIFLGKQYCGQTDRGGTADTGDDLVHEADDVVSVRWDDDLDAQLAELEREIQEKG